MKTVNGIQVYSSLTEILDPQHTALLVVDMQNDEVSSQGWFAQQGRDVSQIQTIIPAMRKMIDVARQSNVPVVFIEQTTLPDNRSDPPGWLYFKTRDGRQRTDYTLDGSWGQQTIDELGPIPTDIRVRKHRPSAFHLTNLDLILRAQGVDSVAVCGNVTQGCVLATSLDAAFHNYYTVLVADCVQSFSQEQHENALRFLASRYDFVTSEGGADIWRTARQGAA